MIRAAAPTPAVPEQPLTVAGWGMERDRARDADAAFGEFVDASSPALARIAWVLVLDTNEAADLVQEALARTYVHWAQLWRSGEDPFPYVRRTLVNVRTDRWRRSTRRRQAEELWRTHTHEYAAARDDPTAVEDTASLARLFRGLTDRQRQVIALRYLQDMSVEGTAAVLNLSRAAVKMATSRALIQLRSAMEVETR